MKILLIALLAIVGLALAAPPSHISSDLLRTLETKGTTNVIISFRKTDHNSLRAEYNAATYATRGAKITDMKTRLEAHFDDVAGDVFSHLNRARSDFQKVVKLWITTQIVVYNADLPMVESLTGFNNIAEVRETRMIPGPEPLNVKPVDASVMIGEQWGVNDVHAPQAWAQGVNGTGVVVATIDTGCRHNHEALKTQWRPNYNWFEPGNTSVGAISHDVQGHGTHTMGTILGTHNGIGVAYGAQGIACLGCRAAGCAEEALLGCGQWVLCPTETDGERADCDKAPHICSNSWGGGNEDPFYDEVIKKWWDAGIVPVFAVGNAGPACATANSPGDGEVPISVGSINDQRHISIFSSRGPTKVTGRIQPDIAAPGTDIVSSFYTSDIAYSKMSGTSMATPHAAGVIALLKSADPTLTPEQIKTLITANAVKHVSVGSVCNGLSDRNFPNHQVGHGLLEADVLLRALRSGKY